MSGGHIVLLFSYLRWNRETVWAVVPPPSAPDLWPPCRLPIMLPSFLHPHLQLDDTLTGTDVGQLKHGWSHVLPNKTDVSPQFWLSLPPQLSALRSQLTDLYLATGGAVVLFSWAQFLREDALRFLDVHAHLELPSDDHSSQHFSLNSQNHNNRDTSESGSTDDLKDSGVSAPPLELIPAEGPNPPNPTWSSRESQGAGTLQESSSPSQHESSEDSWPSDDSQQTAPESEPSDQIQNDLSSEDNKPKPLPLADPDQNSEDFPNERDVSSALPSGSSGEIDPIEQGASALPLHPRESIQNKEPTLSGPPPTPSLTLLSQLLIHDAAQKQREFSVTLFDCGVCFVGWLGSECVQLPECGHIFCQACLSEFCKMQITEGNVRGVTCPETSCKASPTPAQVQPSPVWVCECVCLCVCVCVYFNLSADKNLSQTNYCWCFSDTLQHENFHLTK